MRWYSLVEMRTLDLEQRDREARDLLSLPKREILRSLCFTVGEVSIECLDFGAVLSNSAVSAITTVPAACSCCRGV